MVWYRWLAGIEARYGAGYLAKAGNWISSAISKIAKNPSVSKAGKTLDSLAADVKSKIFAGLGVQSTTKASTALIPYVQRGGGAQVLSNLGKLTNNLATAGGYVVAIDFITDLVSDIGEDNMPAEALEVINDLISEYNSLKELAVRMENAGKNLAYADGDPNLTMNDAVEWQAQSDEVDRLADKAKERQLAVSATDIREKKVKLKRLSQLLGLTPQSTLDCIELLKEVDTSYQPLIDNGLV